MKRCPECLFIYPDTDTRCDFDNTPLVVVGEAELAAATSQAPAKRKRAAKPKKATKKRPRKVTAITAIVGLLLGVAAFLIYYRFASRTHVAQTQTPIVSAPPIVASIPSPSPLATAAPSPTAPPALVAKPATDRVATAHTTTTVAPISTSGPGIGKQPGAKPVILLTSGGKIQADEAWRTRDGVWYRRGGIVTLLKNGRVKAIVNQ